MPEKLMSKSEVNDALESINNKSVLTVKDLNRDQIMALILDTVKNKRTEKRRATQPVKGQELVTLFDKSSLRTYAGTVSAWLRMGGLVVPPLPTNNSREPIEHASRVIGGYADAMVARISSLEKLTEYDKHFLDSNKSKKAIVSGMTDYDHPLQFLADATTTFEKFPDKAFSKLKIAYLGDYNNVARSTFLGYCQLGANIRIGAPNINKLTQEEKDFGDLHNKSNYLFTTDAKEAIADADIVMFDVWTSMGETKDKDETARIHLPYQGNTEIIKFASPNVIVNHCMPINLGEEITEELCNLHFDNIIDQSHNRMHSTESLLAAIYRKH